MSMKTTARELTLKATHSLALTELEELRNRRVDSVEAYSAARTLTDMLGLAFELTFMEPDFPVELYRKAKAAVITLAFESAGYPDAESFQMAAKEQARLARRTGDRHALKEAADRLWVAFAADPDLEACDLVAQPA